MVWRLRTGWLEGRGGMLRGILRWLRWIWLDLLLLVHHVLLWCSLRNHDHRVAWTMGSLWRGRRSQAVRLMLLLGSEVGAW